MPADFELTAKSDEVKAAVGDANKSLRNLGTEMKGIISLTDQFNKQGELFKSVLKGVDAQNRELVSTFKSVQGVLQVVNSQIKEQFEVATKLKEPTNALGSIVDELGKKYKNLETIQRKFAEGDVISSAKLKGINEFNKQVTVTIKNVEGLLKVVETVEGNTIAPKIPKPISLPVINPPASFVASGSKTPQDFVNQLSAQYAGLRIATENVNRAGQTYSATLKGQAADGRNVAISLQSINGQLTLTGSKVSELSKLETGFKDISTALTSVQRSLNFFVTYKAFNFITTSVHDAFEAIQKFQIQVSLIRTLSQDNQLSFGQWAQQIKNVSDELGTPLQDTAEATFLTISNQVAKGQQAIGFVRDAGNLARTTGATTAQAANLLSSAINAYGKSASDATELSALFFKTIDEGRVVAGELSDSFGGVGILGAQLGVDIKDLNANLAFITQSGVRTDTAMTFLRNTLLQLEKPSAALEEFFKQMGVSSGPAAITAVGGLNNLFNKFATAVKGGNVELAKLFPELRGQQALAAVFGRPEDFAALSARFKDTAAQAQTFKNALEIREESDANTISKELNKLKNALTVDLGTKLAALVKSMLDFAGGGKGVADGLNLVLQVTRGVIIAFVTFRTTALVSTGVLAGMNAALAITATNSTSAAVGVTRLNVALSANLFAAAFTIGALAFNYDALTKSIINVPTEKIDAITEANKKFRAEFEKKDIKQTPGVDTFIQGLGPQFAGSAAALAKVQQENIKNLETIKDQNKRFASGVSDTFSTYLNSVKDRLEDLRRKVSESREIIREATRSLADFQRIINDTVQNQALKFATDTQKLGFLDQDIAKKQAEAKVLFSKGDRDSIAEANKLLEETIRLIERRQELIIQGKKDIFEGKPVDPLFAQQLQGRREADFRGRTHFQGNPILDVNIPLLKTQLDQIFNLKKNLTDKLIDLKNKEIKANEASIDAEKVRIKNLEVALKKLDEFSAFDPEGKIKNQFKNPLSDRLDPAKVKKALDEINAEILKTTDKDFKSRLDLEILLQARKHDIISELNAAERVENIRTSQEKLIQIQKEIEAKANANKTAITQASAASESSVQQQRDRLDALEKVKAILTESVKADTGRATNILDVDPGARSAEQNDFLSKASAKNKALIAYTAALSEYKKALDDLQNNREDIQGQRIPRAEDIQKVADAFSRLRLSISDVDAKFPVAAQIQNAAVPGGQAGDTFGTVFRQLQEQINELKKQLFAAQSAKTDQSNLEDRFKDIGSRLADISRLYPEAAKTAAESFKQTTDSILEGIKTLDKLKGAFDRVRPDNNAPENNDFPVFAEGGFVGGRPGVDKNLIRATRGEYVVNARSAYQFSDVLSAINRTKVTSIRGGNIMNTRVGDIVINYTGTGSTTVDAKALGDQIQRHVRRGNL